MLIALYWNVYIENTPNNNLNIPCKGILTGLSANEVLFGQQSLSSSYANQSQLPLWGAYPI